MECQYIAAAADLAAAVDGDGDGVAGEGKTTQRDSGGGKDKDGVAVDHVLTEAAAGEFVGATKELRRDGFALAEQRYLACLPELREFEALATQAAEEEAAAAQSEARLNDKQQGGGAPPGGTAGRKGRR